MFRKGKSYGFTQEFARPLSWHYRREILESASYGTVFVPSFMTIGSEIQSNIKAIISTT
jgi:hypothetical protein